MDVLTNRKYQNFDYTCRYSGLPYYYHTLDNKWVYGIGSNINKDVSYVTHKVVGTDTLDSLSLKYYGNPTYWWAIAYFNDIQDAFEPLIDNFKIINIPAIHSISFTGE